MRGECVGLMMGMEEEVEVDEGEVIYIYILRTIHAAVESSSA